MNQVERNFQNDLDQSPPHSDTKETLMKQVVLTPGWLRSGRRTFLDMNGMPHDLDEELHAAASELSRLEAEVAKARRKYEEAKARVERWDAEHSG